MPIRPRRKKYPQICSKCGETKMNVDYIRNEPICYECMCPDNGPKNVEEWLDQQTQETMLSKGRIYSERIIGNRTKKENRPKDGD
jgi:hypothetical protein